MKIHFGQRLIPVNISQACHFFISPLNDRRFLTIQCCQMMRHGRTRLITMRSQSDYIVRTPAQLNTTSEGQESRSRD